MGDTDMYFILKRDRDGQTLHTADVIRSIEYNREYLSFPKFQFKGSSQDDLTLEFWDDDKGFLNRDDFMVEFEFNIAQRMNNERNAEEEADMINSGQYCVPVWSEPTATDFGFCRTKLGKFGDKKDVPFMVKISTTCLS